MSATRRGGFMRAARAVDPLQRRADEIARADAAEDYNLELTRERYAAARRFTARPDALYLCDNGMCLCGEHLGVTARSSGRDISGQPIYRVRASDITEFPAVACESCGKRFA